MKRLVVVLIVLLAAGAGGYAWLKAPYANAVASGVAREFLALLQDGRLEQAYALTLKGNGLVGRDLAEFRRVAGRQLCTREALSLLRLHPPQSNGNRLRRWLSGREVEMPSITARFEGACLISIELRRDEVGRWRVFNFQSTAG
ncbi:hypothetical protein AAFN46_11475 [Pseudomonas sp. CAU 1711]|uniref:hypothetical protein n=1 Tax=Pseudomonas sp. CAU 1711 TaxID=3140356 RepID=UPI003261B392